MISLCRLVALSSVAVGAQTIAWLVPHSHDDVGWKSTIDGYYHDSVKDIYDNIAKFLSADPSKRFTIVEIAFFSKWWNEDATDVQKDQMRAIIKNGQAEVVHGGWCMEDDANTMYSSSINQMTEGHQWVNKQFGVAPSVAWHIDPFGLSGTLASLWAQAGFNAFVINRIPWMEKDTRKASQELQFEWQGSASSNQTILTHVLDSHYSFPAGHDYEDGELADDQVQAAADKLIDILNQRKTWFRTSNLLIPVGDDFRFKNGGNQFNSWDKLIKNLNARAADTGFVLKYATPSEYFTAVAAATPRFSGNASLPLRQQGSIDWPTKSGDFFPYIDGGSTRWWTGYFTSHSALKRLIREKGNYLRLAEHAGMAAMVGGKAIGVPPASLSSLRRAHGEAQHHDAVTGTAKLAVVEMYQQHLQEGTTQANKVVDAALQAMSQPSATQNPANSSSLLVFNSLGWNYQGVFKTQVDRVDFTVLDADQKAISAQFVVVSAASTCVSWRQTTNCDPDGPRQPDKDLPCDQDIHADWSGYCECADGRHARPTACGHQVFTCQDACSGEVDVWFPVDLPPLGYSTFTFIFGAPSPWSVESVRKPSAGNITMENDILKIVVGGSSGTAGLSIDATNKKDGSRSVVSQRMLEYSSALSGDASGAYIFHPGTDTAQEVVPANDPVFTDGPVFSQVVLKLDDTHSQTLRLFKAPAGEERQMAVELDMVVGPLVVNRELVTRFDLLGSFNHTQAQLWTDSNGVEMRQRSNDLGTSRASQYFPMVSQATATDGKLQFTVVGDRSHGASLPAPTSDTGCTSWRQTTQCKPDGPREPGSDQVCWADIHSDWSGFCECAGGVIPEAGKVACKHDVFTCDDICHSHPTTDGVALEVMLHRRLGRDDNCGLDEALDDSTVVSPTLQLLFGSRSSIEDVRPRINLLHNFRPTGHWQTSAPTVPHFSGLRQALPRNLHLLSLNAFDATDGDWSEALLRVQHVYEAGASVTMSTPVSVDLDALLVSGALKDLQETFLTGAPMPARKRESNVFSLDPLQMRTFHVQL